MNKKYAIGTDIGGSHISCSLIDLENKTLIPESTNSNKVDNKASVGEIIGTWSKTLKSVTEHVDVNELAGIGFAMPGPFDYEKGIALFTRDVAKYESLYGINISQELSKNLNLDSRQFRYMNDASAFAVGEAWLGKAAKVKKSVSITLGTGFGSAFIDDGLPVVEREDVPEMGCVWHLPFNEGIADDYFSTRWFLNRYYMETGERVKGVKDIAEKAVKSDIAKSLFKEFGSNLGQFLGSWLKKFKAEKLIIGGNVSGAYHLFGGKLDSELKEQDIHIVTDISLLMEDAAIVGSAHMFVEDYWQKLKPMLPKM